jgi:hypothetical protein
MKIAAVTWGSDLVLLTKACNEFGIELNAWSTHDVEEEKKREECIKYFEQADIILLHPSNEEHWNKITEGLNKKVPTIYFGHDSTLCWLSNVSPKVVATVNAYYVYGGAENTARHCGRAYTIRMPKLLSRT